MKTTPFPTSLVFKGLALLSIAGLSLSTATSAEAAVAADFSGGNSSSIVDAWQGMPGDGWKTAWSIGGNNSIKTHMGVISTNPFSPDSGNYLSVNMESETDDSDRTATIGRQYDSSVINYSEAHTVSFEFRLDTPVAELRRIYFFDKNLVSLSPESADTTWMIRINPSGNIMLFDRTSSSAAPITFVAGEVYRFTINITPSAVPTDSIYTVRIENLTQSTSYDSGELHFYTPSASVGGYLNFNASVLKGAGNNYTYSLDNISVIPESSTVALGGVGLLMLLASRRVLGR